MVGCGINDVRRVCVHVAKLVHENVTVSVHCAWCDPTLLFSITVTSFVSLWTGQVLRGPKKRLVAGWGPVHGLPTFLRPGKKNLLLFFLLGFAHIFSSSIIMRQPATPAAWFSLKNICKFFQIFRYIESCGVCMKH
jgi:hypothetical protein